MFHSAPISFVYKIQARKDIFCYPEEADGVKCLKCFGCLRLFEIIVVSQKPGFVNNCHRSMFIQNSRK